MTSEITAKSRGLKRAARIAKYKGASAPSIPEKAVSIQVGLRRTKALGILGVLSGLAELGRRILKDVIWVVVQEG